MLCLAAPEPSPPLESCLAADMEWNEAVQQFHFWLGWNRAIKNELAQVDSPAALTNFISLCINIDIQLTERECECCNS